MLTARNCYSVGKQPHLPRKARETSTLWKTTSSLIVHSLLLQHIPPGWLILQEGQEQNRESGRQQKGRGKSRVQRKGKKKKTFARAAENPAQKGQERKQRIRNTRQAELFRSEEVSKILGHQGRGRMGKYEHTGQGVRDTSGNNRDISTSSPSRSWGREGRRNRGIQ